MKKPDSMPPDEKLRDLEEFVLQRARKRGLRVDLAKMAYLQDSLRPYLSPNGEKVLYVGVGHGLDAVYALLTGVVQEVVGVDPYYSDHGNDDDDYQILEGLIGRCRLEDRFKVHRGTIQEYLDDCREEFSAVVISDALHHIFVTRSRLSRSPHLLDSAELFRIIGEHTRPGGALLVQETERWGLRQILTRLGLMSGSVDYRTKQSWREWRRAAVEGGFVFRGKVVYVPWALRRWRRMLDNPLGQYTASDRSLAVYGKPA